MTVICLLTDFLGFFYRDMEALLHLLRLTWPLEPDTAPSMKLSGECRILPEEERGTVC